MNNDNNKQEQQTDLPPGETVTINEVIKSLEKLKENISGLTPVYTINFPLCIPMPVQTIGFGYTKQGNPGVFLVDSLAYRMIADTSQMQHEYRIEEL